jgi:hypothetical protein
MYNRDALVKSHIDDLYRDANHIRMAKAAHSEDAPKSPVQKLPVIGAIASALLVALTIAR